MSYKPALAYRFVGDKQYELSNHLGNVLSVISDRSLFVQNVFMPDVLSFSDYFPFGMLVPTRHGSSGNYRYGFNGKENDNEIFGEGNSIDFGARMLDSRIGRWLTVDPLAEQGPEYSPYCYTFNNPINLIDPDGRWPDNPFSGLINRAKSAARNYISNKISNVVSATRSYVHQKSKAILNAVTPSSPFTKAKPEKAEKASGFGVSFATEGGKEGGMKSPQGGRDVPQVDMSVIIGLTDIWGPETTIPGVVPDGSNPFVKSPDGGDEVKSESTMNKTGSNEIQIEIPAVTFDVSGNGSRSANLHYKDTIVNKKDSAKVTDEAKNKQQNDIKNFNKAHGTNF